jgi:opacity protein-like surface antigen
MKRKWPQIQRFATKSVATPCHGGGLQLQACDGDEMRTQFYGTPTFLSQFGSADRVGWTVGGGLEYMFAKGWSVFGEYNYMDFGRQENNFASGPGLIGAPGVVSTRLTVQTEGLLWTS